MNMIIQKSRTPGKSMSTPMAFYGISNLQVRDLSAVQHYRATLKGRVHKVWSVQGDIAVSFGDDEEPTHRWHNGDWKPVTFLAFSQFPENAKIKFRGHRPGFIDADDAPPELAFDTLDELLAMDWVKGFSEHEHFNHYALGLHQTMFRGDKGEHHLMGVYKDGKEWWVIGYLSENATRLGLPIWKAP